MIGEGVESYCDHPSYIRKLMMSSFFHDETSQWNKMVEMSNPLVEINKDKPMALNDLVLAIDLCQLISRSRTDQPSIDLVLVIW